LLKDQVAEITMKLVGTQIQTDKPEELSRIVNELNQDPNSTVVYLGGKDASELAYQFGQRSGPGAEGVLLSQGNASVACAKNIDTNEAACTVSSGPKDTKPFLTKNPNTIALLSKLAAPSLVRKLGDAVPFQWAYVVCTQVKTSSNICAISSVPH
jgi:hypothetical protein